MDKLLSMRAAGQPGSRDAVKPTRTRRKEARPGELLNAAIAVFARTGLHAASMEEIGARAGVSKGTVYLYYGTKERLFAQAVRHGTEVLLDAVDRAAKGQDSAPRMLHRLVSAWDVLATGQSTGAVVKLLLIESSALPSVAECTESLFERMHASVRALVERGVRDGDFRPCNTGMVARIICAALCGHALGRCCSEMLPGAEKEDLYTHLELVLHGLSQRKKCTGLV